MVNSLENFANGANITDGKLNFENYVNKGKIGSGGYGDINLYIHESLSENKISLPKLIRVRDHYFMNAVTGQSVPLAEKGSWRSVNEGANPEGGPRLGGAGDPETVDAPLQPVNKDIPTALAVAVKIYKNKNDDEIKLEKVLHHTLSDDMSIKDILLSNGVIPFYYGKAETLHAPPEPSVQTNFCAMPIAYWDLGRYFYPVARLKAPKDAHRFIATIIKNNSKAGDITEEKFDDFQRKMKIPTSSPLELGMKKLLSKEELDKLIARNAGINEKQATWCALQWLMLLRRGILDLFSIFYRSQVSIINNLKNLLEKGIIHNDLKLQNILFSYNEGKTVFYLCDLGGFSIPEKGIVDCAVTYTPNFIAEGGDDEEGKVVVVYGIGIIVLQTLIGLLNLLVEMPYPDNFWNEKSIKILRDVYENIKNEFYQTGERAHHVDMLLKRGMLKENNFQNLIKEENYLKIITYFDYFWGKFSQDQNPVDSDKSRNICYALIRNIPKMLLYEITIEEVADLLAPTEQTLQETLENRRRDVKNETLTQTNSLAVDPPVEPDFVGGGWTEPEKYELFFEPEELSNPFTE